MTAKEKGLVARNTKNAREGDRKIGMCQGVALTISLMLRNEDVQSIWSACGMTIEDCISNEVDIYDMEKIIPEFATIDDLELIANYYIDNPQENDNWVNAAGFMGEMNAMMKSDLFGIELSEALLLIKERYLKTIKESK